MHVVRLSYHAPRLNPLRLARAKEVSRLGYASATLAVGVALSSQQADALDAFVASFGDAPDAARLIPVARVECGCRAVAPVSSSRTPWPWLLALAGVLAVRRGRRAERTRGFVGRAVGLLVVGVVASTQTACTEVRVPAEPDSGAAALDVGSRDAAMPDAAPPVDTGPRERPDGGPWSEGPCRLADPDVVRVVDAPGRTQPWAAHRQLTLSPLSGGAQGYAAG
jgi:hypothetical protein